jgi:hypothetical protein
MPHFLRWSSSAHQPLAVSVLIAAAVCTLLLLSVPIWGQQHHPRRGKKATPRVVLPLAPDAALTVITRHGGLINQARIEGNLHQQLPENLVINQSNIVGGLFLGGNFHLKRRAVSYKRLLTATGAPSAPRYTLSLNDCEINHIVQRALPLTWPLVSLTTPVNADNEDVIIHNGLEASMVNFSKARNITLSPEADNIVVPPGVYGTLIANNYSRFIFGDGKRPTVYHLAELILNDTSQLRILGPVELHLANGMTISSNSVVGNDDHALDLVIRVTAGQVVLATDAKLFANVIAPQSRVVINGDSLLQGALLCDELFINDGIIRCERVAATNAATAPVH